MSMMFVTGGFYILEYTNLFFLSTLGSQQADGNGGV